MPLSESVLIVMVLLATGIVASGLFRRLPIPYTVILVIIGIALGQLADAWQPAAPLQQLQLTPELVLFIFLPALIFESGLNLNARQLVKDIAPVLMLAVPALLFSTAAIGLAVWSVLPVDLMVALLFGALISATDPVAVIALFKELGTPERLTVLVEGESLLNDATAIVVVGILLTLTAMTGSAWSVAGGAVLQFLIVFCGGALIGILFGLIISWMMGRFASETSAVLVLSVVLAYLAFVIAEHSFHVSGVMAVVASAIVLGIFGIPRMSTASVEVMHETWEFIAHVCNTLLFLFVGLLVDLGSLVADIGIIVFAYLMVQLTRASMVYSLVPMAERVFSLPHVTIGERHIMFWGGLKGGLAIAIVLSLPVDLPGREHLINLTLGVVLFSLLLNAPTIRPLIRKLGLDALSDEERAEVKRGLAGAAHGVDDTLQRFGRAGLISDSGCQELRESARRQLESWMPDVIAADDFRFQRLNALRAELSELDALYRAGVLKQYRWLDLRGELQRKHDHILAGARISAIAGERKSTNLFLLIEDVIIKRLRERDWAAVFLQRYQNRRVTGHMMRDIARILMSQAALDCIEREQDISDEHRAQLTGIYQQHLAAFRDNLQQLSEHFPQLRESFESRMGARVALIAALREIKKERHDGLLTAKSFLFLEHRLQQAISAIPGMSDVESPIESRELIENITLFSGLDTQTLDEIAGRANTVNYLHGDSVIASGEHGDALYVVVHGALEVRVSTTEGPRRVGELGSGDFFGEMALLGDHVRSADVVATSTCTLLRIRCKDVMEIAERHPSITERLDAARAERSRDAGDHLQ